MNQLNSSDWDPRDEEVLRNQTAAYDDMRKRCPVAYSDFLGWSLFRHEDVIRVLYEPEIFQNRVSKHLSVPNGIDLPDHTAYRKIIDPFFSPEKMEVFEPKCRAISTQLVQSLMINREVEFISKFSQPFAVQNQCAFVDWPDEMQNPVLNWSEKNQKATLSQNREELNQLAREFEEFIKKLLDNHSDNNTTSSIARLLRSQINGRPLNTLEIASIFRNWTVGEVYTIASSIGILVYFLAKDACLQDKLRHNSSLLPYAIEEILRIQGPLVSNRRITTQPVEIGGRKIESGEKISLMWVSANRDEQVFEDPTSFRWDRNMSLNLLYGAGIHYCPGAPLARLQMRVALEALLKQTTKIQLISDQKPANAVYPVNGYLTLPLYIE